PRKDSSRRSSRYRRRGPGRKPVIVRVLSGARTARHARAGSPSPSQWALLAALVPALGLVAARRRLHVPPPVTLALVSAAPVAMAAATPRRPWRYAAVGAVYMGCFAVTWTLPYEQPEKLRRRLRIHYPIRIDSVLGLGTPPTQRLQCALRDPPRVTALDRAVTLAYASWFVPHALLAYLLFRHEEFVPRAAARLAAAYHLTTPFYYLIPTAPPWWASEEAGLMDGEVERVRRHVLNELARRPRQTKDQSGGNPWASMPSDHVASAAITAMGLAEIGPIYGTLGWLYVALASFSVVYLGEHYLIDALAGLAIAETIRRGEARVAPLVHRGVFELNRFGR
ncbi:MAG: phosphatase PAP2 family protein, partial [Actinomycetota bacterium]|nr:phosphatase PAP2 family protein [Actinomycetota bacterium]